MAAGYPYIRVTKKSLDTLLKEAVLKVDGVKSVISPYNREQMAKVAFTVGGTAFIRQLNAKAKANRSAFHHIYEWNQVGTQKGRLFGLVRTSVKAGNLVITSQFYESNTPVPISKSLTKGVRSVNRQHVFKNKANVMEDGIPVRIRAKFAKALVFPTQNGTMFVPKGKSVLVRNPGGNAVKNSFTKEFKTWFKNPVNVENAVMATGYFRALEREIAKSLKPNGSGRANVSSVIANVSARYSKGANVL